MQWGNVVEDCGRSLCTVYTKKVGVRKVILSCNCRWQHCRTRLNLDLLQEQRRKPSSLLINRLLISKWLSALFKQTIVKKTPNSGSIKTISPSVNVNWLRRSFLQAKMMAICWAATDKAANSMRLNSSKQPHDPDLARPAKYNKKTRLDCPDSRSSSLQNSTKRRTSGRTFCPSPGGAS